MLDDAQISGLSQDARRTEILAAKRRAEINTNLAALAARVTVNEADIATNVADIATNTADIATNTADIATNTADIATNTANIATNASGIASNDTDIASIQTRLAGISTTVDNGGYTAQSMGIASPWTGTLYALRSGNWVTVVIFVDRAAVTINGPWTLSTFPAGWRPTYGSVYPTATYLTSTSGTVVSQTVWMQLDTAGALTVRSRINNAVALRASFSYISTP